MIRLVAAEWLKLRTLPSFWICAGTALFVTPAGAALSGRVAAVVLQAVIIVVAAIVPGSEYATGTVRTTFLAAPRRIAVMTAKALVVTVVAVVLGTVCLMLAYAVVTPVDVRYGTVMGRSAVDIGYCVLVALFAFAVTLAVKHTASAVSLALSAVLLVRLVLMVVTVMFGADPPTALGNL
jgi:ABC-2 type transport system permease protein